MLLQNKIEQSMLNSILKIKVEDFPAFILVDDKGNDFFKTIGL